MNVENFETKTHITYLFIYRTIYVKIMKNN